MSEKQEKQTHLRTLDREVRLHVDCVRAGQMGEKEEAMRVRTGCWIQALGDVQPPGCVSAQPGLEMLSLLTKQVCRIKGRTG